MWVKICANTNAEDALAAAELGADAVGFVFAPSKRQVTPGQVRAISDVMPAGVERVGVFAGATAGEIAGTVATARLNTVQLHGEFDHALTERLEVLLGGEVAVIQTVAWDVESDPPFRDVASQLERIVGHAPGRRVLVDAKVKGATGGTGTAYRWSSAAELLARYRERGLEIIVAGGLRPENVVEAIGEISPWGVDVASGVEREPGRKDHAKVREFIKNARGA